MPEPMPPADLRRALLRLHRAAERAITPGLDFERWYAQHGKPTLLLRVDQWVLASKHRDGGTLERAHLRLRSQFYVREAVLIARAEMAADPTDENKARLEAELARVPKPPLEREPMSRSVELVADVI